MSLSSCQLVWGENCILPHRGCHSRVQSATGPWQDHLGEILPAVLGGLADEAEGVRDAALSAGRTAVELFAGTSLPLLLPAVEAGILHDNWRIRQSSVELLGDLLFKVLCKPVPAPVEPLSSVGVLPRRRPPFAAPPSSCVGAEQAGRGRSIVGMCSGSQVAGTSGKVHMDGDSDEEGASSEAHGSAIIEALGWDRRNEVRPLHAGSALPQLAQYAVLLWPLGITVLRACSHGHEQVPARADRGKHLHGAQRRRLHGARRRAARVEDGRVQHAAHAGRDPAHAHARHHRLAGLLGCVLA